MVYTDLCSFYFSVFDEHAVDMTLKEFVKLLRGERWKVQVEEYQRLKASGRETEAKKLKRKLAALVIAGRCDGSHAETNLKQWSGDAMLDVDKCNGRVSEFLQVLKDTPWGEGGMAQRFVRRAETGGACGSGECGRVSYGIRIGGMARGAASCLSL
jgi:VirE N-terminal domain.